MSASAGIDLSYREAPDNRQLAHIPGHDGLPLIGRTLAVVRDFKAVCDEHQHRWGPVSRIRLMDQVGLLVTGADLYQRIYQDRDGIFSCEMGYSSQLGAFYQGGLLLKDFDEHRVQRRLMQGAFKLPALQRYLEMMHPLIRQHVAAWGELDRLIFYPRVKQLLLEIGARCFLGLDNLDANGERINSMFLELNGGMVALLRRELPVGAFGRAKRARRGLEAWFTRLVIERRRDGGGDDMLSHLCRETDEAGQPYAVNDIVSHAIFLLFAAHDTTTSALTHLMIYLGRDPDLQQRLRESLRGFDDRPLTHAECGGLTLAAQCIDETLRLHPPVPMMVRRTLRDTEIGGYAVPAHTILFMPTLVNQRDPQWWSEPERFDPDRFSPARAEQRRHAMCFHPLYLGV